MSFVQVYRRVIGLLSQEKFIAAMLVLANLGLAAAALAQPVLFGRIIDVLTGSNETIVDRGLPLLIAWGGIGIAAIGANVAVALYADRMAHRRRLAALAAYFEHVLALPLAFHEQSHSGRLLKVMLQGTDHLFGIWLGFLREHCATFVALIVLVPLTLYLNWRLALLLIGLAFVITALTFYVFARTQGGQKEVEALHSGLAAQITDAMGNVPVVQSFGRRVMEARMLRDAADRLLRAQYPVLNWWAVANVLVGASTTITVMAIFGLGAWLHIQGAATVGEIVTFMGLANQLIGRLDQVVAFARNMFLQVPALAEFFEIMDTVPQVSDAPGAVEIPRASGLVEFTDVSYSYRGGRAPTLNRLSLTVEPGKTVAFVGPTGAGKTTALALLYRAFDPDAGKVLLDGRDLREITLDSLRANVGVVFQDAMLFARTIGDNIRIGRPDATDAEVEAAAKLAEAHEFIMNKPLGYGTVVSERGASLSGGERQRIAIARAFLKDPPILVLDEATSALDVVTEARIQRAMAEVRKGRTCFLIAHRLSTVRDADAIAVMRQGALAEFGPYDELLARGGVFSELVNAQSGRAAPDFSA